MTKDFSGVVQDAMNLDTEDRVKLDMLLLDSLVEIDLEIEGLWIDECNRRLPLTATGR